jgi:WD40 repeat protein
MYLIKKIIIFDLETCNRTDLFDGNLLNSNSVRYSNDEKLLSLESSRFNLYHTWAISKKNSSLQKVSHDKEIYNLSKSCSWNGQTLSYSPDGRFIAYGDNSANVYICNLEFVDEKIKLEVEDNLIYPKSIQFSPDVKFIAVGSADKTIRVWDTTYGKETVKMKGHLGSINSVCYSPDGNSIVSASFDCTIRVWNSKTGKQLMKFEGYLRPVHSACYSPCGKFIASIGEERDIRIWSSPEEIKWKKTKSFAFVRSSVKKVDSSNPIIKVLQCFNISNLISKYF